LQDQEPARPDDLPRAAEERGREHSLRAVGDLVVGLRVVDVELVDARGLGALEEEGDGVAPGVLQVREPALARAPRGVLDRGRDEVDPEVVVRRPRERAAEEEAPVAAAEVEDARGFAAEDRFPVERVARPRDRDARSRPARALCGAAGKRDAEVGLAQECLSGSFMPAGERAAL
jgi:hypothetical protein